MPVMHPVIGVCVVGLFVAHFFDQPSERWAGHVTQVYLVNFVSQLLLLFHFRFYDFVQSLLPPEAEHSENIVISSYRF